jgi:hypothetical protein
MLLAGLVLALPTALLAADPPAGSYKVMLPLQEGERPLWLLTLESKDGKWSGSTVAAPGGGIPEAKVEDVKVDKDTLSLTLNLGKAGAFQFEGKVRKEKDAKLLGTVTVRGKEAIFPAILEPTTLTSLDPFEVSRELLARSSEGVEVTEAAIVCLSRAEEKKVKPDEAKVWAEKAVKAAEPFGPKWKRTVVMQLAAIFGAQDGFTGLALDYADQAEKTLDAGDPPALQKRVLTLLADALEKAGKKEDAKKVRERSDRIAAVTAKPFPGRKGKSDRVALVEMFTSAQQPESVAPDTAAAALVTAYKPTDVVVLEYHLNVPGGDPLSCPESEARAKFYETSRVTPAVIFNGRKAPPSGGGDAESQARYDQFTELLAEKLEEPAKMKITAAATRKGNKIDVKVDVADLPETGPDIRLRVALVEDHVDYTGANKLGKHVQVVRQFLNGAAGTAMKAKSASETFTVDLDTLRKNLKTYQEKVNENTPFPNKERPMELKKLRVVAFVQNDDTGEVLNAVQVDVKGE